MPLASLANTWLLLSALLIWVLRSDARIHYEQDSVGREGERERDGVYVPYVSFPSWSLSTTLFNCRLLSFCGCFSRFLFLFSACYVGCIKFLESYYLILVTKRRQIGCICGHVIYCIDESQMITIPHSSVQTDVATSKNELRYKKEPFFLRCFTLLSLHIFLYICWIKKLIPL